MAELTIIFGGQEQNTIKVDKDRLVAGRDPTCDIPIDNLGISRQHCAFENRGETFLVQDLGSSNGTYVNGKKVTHKNFTSPSLLVAAQLKNIPGLRLWMKFARWQLI